MASLAPLTAPQRAPLPAKRPARRPAAARPRRRTTPGPRLAGSVTWILVVATLLAGIVALNVALLRLNVQSERLDADKEKLAARHDRLVSELSRAAAAGRIEAIAVRQLGLERPVDTTYVRLGLRTR